MSGSDNDNEGYKFDITNGQVTGIERVFGSHTENLRLPSDATFTVGATNVTETLAGKLSTETIQFVQDASDATLYHVGSGQTIVTDPTTIYGGHTFGYEFTIANGAVTALQIEEGSSSHTFSHAVQTGPTTSYAVDAGGSVTATAVYGNTVETTTYVQSGSAGLYAVASDTQTFVQTGGSATHLDVQPYERDKFTIDGSGAVTQVQQVRSDGSTMTITPHSGTTYSQLEAGYVLEVQTHGTHSSYEVYHDGNGDGIYTEVAHGSGSTVDLVGLKAQITPTIAHVL